jgi:hypothetical protein
MASGGIFSKCIIEFRFAFKLGRARKHPHRISEAIMCMVVT